MVGGGVCVIGSEYCSSGTVELAVVRKVMPKPDGTIFVGDNRNNTIFKMEIKTSDFSMHEKRVLLDSQGTCILTFRDKLMTLRNRWEGYEGQSTEEKDLIFTTKESKMMGSKKELNVYLASNKKEKKWDFKVGSSYDVIYAGGSRENIIAEMIRDYTVKIYSNVDAAFIISLIVILDGINQQKQQNTEIVAQGVSAGGTAMVNSVTGAIVI